MNSGTSLRATHARWTIALGVALALGVTTLGAAQSAWACGGCFSPPVPQGGNTLQTVVQDAERVVFHQDPKTKQSTVWVEVRYTGLAEDFGWVLPLPKQPTVTVGSSLLFDRLDARMAPKVKLIPMGDENCRQPRDGCEVPPQQDAGGSWGYADASVAMDSGATGGGEAPQVQVLDHGQAGPYDFAVVKSDKAQPLMDWLDARGYAVPKSALPIVDSHVAKGDVFVAIKLSNGNGINLIRPVVLTMDDAEPCVPLRLTSIAAQDDMTVSVTVAGPGRAVPKNYLHVQINPLRLNLFAGANNYPNAVSAAIDEAAGRAFVTEYSQTGAQVGSLFLYGGALLDTISDANNLYDLAMAMGSYGEGWLHADVAEIFEKQIGVTKLMTKLGAKTPTEALGWLWSCGSMWSGGMEWLPCTPPGASGFLEASEAKKIPVASKGLAAGLKEGIIDPIHKVADGLKSADRVTRMLLRISPAEMDRDPMFGFNKALPTVSNQLNVRYRRVCSEGWWPPTRSRVAIDGLDGSWVFPGTIWNGNGNNAQDPRFKDAPLAMSVELLDESGGPMILDPSEIALVDTAIQGAVPGKASLPSGMTIKTGQPWTPPVSDDPVKKLGPWKQPDNCIPKSGWKDGQLPPAGDVPVGDDIGPIQPDGTGAPRVDGTSGQHETIGGPGDAASGSNGGGSKDSGGCSAAPSATGFGASVALLAALLVLGWRRRRTA